MICGCKICKGSDFPLFISRFDSLPHCGLGLDEEDVGIHYWLFYCLKLSELRLLWESKSWPTWSKDWHVLYLGISKVAAIPPFPEGELFWFLLLIFFLFIFELFEDPNCELGLNIFELIFSENILYF
jgi:hypothetical protein